MRYADSEFVWIVPATPRDLISMGVATNHITRSLLLVCRARQHGEGVLGSLSFLNRLVAETGIGRVEVIGYCTDIEKSYSAFRSNTVWHSCEQAPFVPLQLHSQRGCDAGEAVSWLEGEEAWFGAANE